MLGANSSRLGDRRLNWLTKVIVDLGGIVVAAERAQLQFEKNWS